MSNESTQTPSRWTEAMVAAISIGTQLEYMGYTSIVERIVGQGRGHDGKLFKVIEARYRSTSTITTSVVADTEIHFIRPPKGGIVPLDLECLKEQYAADAYARYGVRPAAYAAADIVVAWRCGERSEVEANNALVAIGKKYGCLSMSRRQPPTVMAIYSAVTA